MSTSEVFVWYKLEHTPGHNHEQKHEHKPRHNNALKHEQT